MALWGRRRSAHTVRSRRNGGTGRTINIEAAWCGTFVLRASARQTDRGLHQTSCSAGTNVSISMIVLTIGHSTRAITAFIRLLEAHGVQRVIDVRTIPRSAHNPQFNRDTPSRTLRRARIHYRHMPGLGGLRHARKDSTNTGWRNLSFRGYADYMQTTAFRRSLERCIKLARDEQVALMCAEAVPWRCHRSLIAVALVARRIDVREIVSGVQ